MSATDSEAGRFWHGCDEGRFLLQRCGTHGHLQYPPGPVCRTCGSAIDGWIDAAREGTVEAFSLVTRPPTAAFEPHVPYMVAVVKLTEGPIVETWLRLDGRTPEIAEVAVGRPVHIAFEPINGKTVPVAVLR